MEPKQTIPKSWLAKVLVGQCWRSSTLDLEWTKGHISMPKIWQQCNDKQIFCSWRTNGIMDLSTNQILPLNYKLVLEVQQSPNVVLHARIIFSTWKRSLQGIYTPSMAFSSSFPLSLLTDPPCLSGHECVHVSTKPELSRTQIWSYP